MNDSIDDSNAIVDQDIENQTQPEHIPDVKEDYLLNILLWFFKFDHNTKPVEAILEGLPVHQNISLHDFCKGAEKLGYEITYTSQPLHTITHEYLPCVIPLKENQACIFINHDHDIANIIWPEQGMTPKKIKLKKLEEARDGQVLLMKLKFVIDQRAHHPHLATNDQWFWNVLRKTYPIYGEVFLASIFINIFAVLGSLFSMNVYDRVVPNGAIETLYTLASGMILMHLFDFMLKVVRGYFLDVINKKTDIRLTSMIFDHLLHIQMLAKPKSVGSFSSMIGQFESFRDFFTSASMATLIDIPFVLFFIGVIWFLSGPLVLAVVLAIPFIVIATLVTQYMCYERVKLSMRLSSQKNALLIEYLGSLEAIKFWGAQSQLQQRWDAIIAESARVHTEIKTIQSLSSNFCQVVQSLSYVGMICYGVTLIIAHQLTMGALIGASILSSKALTPILQVGQLMLRWQHAKSSLEGMDQLMKMPLETQENALSVYDMKGHFQFSKVKFTYAEGSLPTLVDIDLEIKAGDRIGIVGANGSGKSTLIKMLLGLYRATEGNLLLDGMDIKQFNMTSLRRAIGYVPQDIHLVHGTLRENITMGCEYVTQQALLRATHDAGLMDFIGQHPKGLDMMIGERGETLSGGQRQAIALARALLNDPKILILDEPTSALDFQAESQFIENVQRILIDKTLIIVSHRQAPLRLCQELIVMHQGRIVKRQPLQFEVAKGAS